MDSYLTHDDVGGFFLDFERPRCSAQVRKAGRRKRKDEEEDDEPHRDELSDDDHDEVRDAAYRWHFKVTPSS